MVLQGLNPQRVFYYFEQLCAIPHGSGDTKAISDWCMEIALKLGLQARQDTLNNVLICKPGSKGKEQAPTVILQGHLDMVCQKDADVEFDFAKDGLKLKAEGDLLSAQGTTLGGDDGIAVAMALAILEDNELAHPPLEVLFTVDEETGMDGAAGLDGSWLQGRTLINIDSEEEGVLTVGCAGGARADILLEMTPAAVAEPCYRIEISGLAGGHSGVEIHKGRYNANKLMGLLLKEMGQVCLIELQGGEKDNVICPRCQSVISTAANVQAVAEEFVQRHRHSADPHLQILVTPVDKEMVGYDSVSTAAAVELLCQLPQGVQKMSEDIEGLVQTSLNLGIMKLEEDQLRLSFSLRSSVAAEKQQLLQQLFSIAHRHGAEVQAGGEYPAWEYRKESPLRDTMIRVYHRLYGKAPRVEIIHAGLECGLLGEKLPGMDGVSIGPQMWDIHSPRERLSISSTQRTYNYLCEVLKEL